MKPKATYRVLSLKPCQFAVGMVEVDRRISQLRLLTRKQLKALVRATPIPIVISPEDDLYMVDHHHFLFACWEVGVKKVKVEVARNFSAKQMTYTQFWHMMRKERYFYPYSQFGDGPHAPLYLPRDIRGIADDPYRSLAWLVRSEHGYGKTDVRFGEFQWANFFRAKKLLHKQGRKGFGQAAEKARLLAKTSEAKNLPGFNGK